MNTANIHGCVNDEFVESCADTAPGDRKPDLMADGCDNGVNDGFSPEWEDQMEIFLSASPGFDP